jgi:hypothetical protein
MEAGKNNVPTLFITDTNSSGICVPVLLTNPALNFFALDRSDFIVAWSFPRTFILLIERLW